MPKAGFKFVSGCTAHWGPKQHPASEWQRWRKVHKHSTKQAEKLQTLVCNGFHLDSVLFESF